MSCKRKEKAAVVSQEQIAENIYSMWIQTEEISDFAVPGQFISMYTEDQSKLLPRPISLCEIDREKKRLRVVYRVTGKGTGTEQFSRLRPGESIQILGPLGNGFPMEPGTGKKVCLIGGGIGVPPMLELSKQLHAEKQLVMGYRDELFLTEEFEKKRDTVYCDRGRQRRYSGKCHGCHCAEGPVTGGDLRLRAGAHAACREKLCGRKTHSMLCIYGGADGLRSRGMPCLRLPDAGD